MKFYPYAHKNRLHGSDSSVRGTRIAFMKAAAINFLLLQALFLAAFSYIYGALYQQGSHVYRMEVLYVDYDGGVIGTSVRDAYKTLQGNGFPSLLEGPISEFPTPGDLKSAVCRAQYWAAVYTSPGASDRLEAALAGGSAATTYNGSNVLAYIWNEARYSAVVDTTISGSIQNLSSTARVTYAKNNGTGALQTLPSTDPVAISIFANPWQLSSINIQPTTQGSRLIYNTIVIILILIQEFFYLGTINGLYVQFKIYERLYPHRIIFIRNLISVAFTFIGSLCTTGAIWAFRDDWQVNSNQFALSWAILWLFAHLNFLTLDVFTIWLPPPYIPMALVTWIVLNVASILIPFELSPGFYRWGYAMPTHEVYQVLTDIWSGGCNPQLYYALPILFAFEVSGLILSALGVYRRCHYAVMAEEAQKDAFSKRLDAALAFERKREQEKQETPGASFEPRSESDRVTDEQNAEAIEEERDELAEAIRQVDSKTQKEQTGSSSRGANFGPSFDLAYGTQPQLLKDSIYNRRTSI